MMHTIPIKFPFISLSGLLVENAGQTGKHTQTVCAHTHTHGSARSPYRYHAHIYARTQSDYKELCTCRIARPVCRKPKRCLLWYFKKTDWSPHKKFRRRSREKDKPCHTNSACGVAPTRRFRSTRSAGSVWRRFFCKRTCCSSVSINGGVYK